MGRKIFISFLAAALFSGTGWATNKCKIASIVALAAAASMTQNGILGAQLVANNTGDCKDQLEKFSFNSSCTWSAANSAGLELPACNPDCPFNGGLKLQIAFNWPDAPAYCCDETCCSGDQHCTNADGLYQSYRGCDGRSNNCQLSKKTCLAQSVGGVQCSYKTTKGKAICTTSGTGNFPTLEICKIEDITIFVPQGENGVATAFVFDDDDQPDAKITVEAGAKCKWDYAGSRLIFSVLSTKKSEQQVYIKDTVTDAEFWIDCFVPSNIAAKTNIDSKFRWRKNAKVSGFCVDGDLGSEVNDPDLTADILRTTSLDFKCKKPAKKCPKMPFEVDKFLGKGAVDFDSLPEKPSSPCEWGYYLGYFENGVYKPIKFVTAGISTVTIDPQSHPEFYLHPVEVLEHVPSASECPSCWGRGSVDIAIKFELASGICSRRLEFNDRVGNKLD